MVKRCVCFTLIGSGLLAAGAATGLAWDGEEVSLDQVPAKVRATLLKLAHGATIDEVERETEGGITTYEAEWLVSGDALLVKHGQDYEFSQAGQDERFGLLKPVFLDISIQFMDGAIEDLDSFGARCRGSELVSFHGSQPSDDNEHALEQRDQLVSDLYTHGGNRPLRV